MLSSDDKALLLESHIFFGSEYNRHRDAYEQVKRCEKTQEIFVHDFDETGRSSDLEDFCRLCGEYLMWNRASCTACHASKYIVCEIVLVCSAKIALRNINIIVLFQKRKMGYLRNMDFVSHALVKLCTTRK